MVPQNMIDNSNIFGDISLKKRSLLMMPSFLFDDIINKMVSDQQIIQQSCEPVNYLIDHHHFMMGIAEQISTVCHVWNLRY